MSSLCMYLTSDVPGAEDVAAKSSLKQRPGEKGQALGSEGTRPLGHTEGFP
jgi:hypothetical protein